LAIRTKVKFASKLKILRASSSPPVTIADLFVYGAIAGRVSAGFRLTAADAPVFAS
jgi:hypothetical protein